MDFTLWYPYAVPSRMGKRRQHHICRTDAARSKLRPLLGWFGQRYSEDSGVHLQEVFRPLRQKAFCRRKLVIISMLCKMFPCSRGIFHIYMHMHALLWHSHLVSAILRWNLCQTLPLVPCFLVAMFQAENSTTSVLVSQCSCGGSVPFLLWKYCCWGCWNSAYYTYFEVVFLVLPIQLLKIIWFQPQLYFVLLYLRPQCIVFVLRKLLCSRHYILLTF